MAWLTENLGTIIVSALILAAAVAVSIRLIKKKKSGGCNCGDCGGCCSCCPAREKESDDVRSREQR